MYNNGSNNNARKILFITGEVGETLGIDEVLVQNSRESSNQVQIYLVA